MRCWLIWGLMGTAAWADDLVVCDPSALVTNQVVKYEQSVDPSALSPNANRLVWTATNETHTEKQKGSFESLRVQLDALTAIQPSHWKCVDADADGSLEGVVEMTHAEKDTVDAPVVARALESASLTAERSSNPVCEHTLKEIDDYVDSQLTPVVTFVDAKQVLATVLKEIARCGRARAGVE